MFCRIRFEALLTLHGSINLPGWHDSLLHQSVRNNCCDLSVEEVQNPVLHSTDACAKFVDIVSKIVRLGPAEFVSQFPKPLQAQITLVLHLLGQLAKPFQEWT
jgi:hypothetical protein